MYTLKKRQQVAKAFVAMAEAPKSVAELEKVLGTSRWSVHRLLNDMVEQGLAHRIGEPPKTRYGIFDATKSAEDGQCALLLNEILAHALCRGLESVVRACLGQADIALEVLRWHGNYSDGGPALLEKIEKALKLRVGLTPSSSWGIYNEQLPQGVRQLWRLKKLLEHRLAWDHQPEGGFGVNFDEPLEPVEWEVDSVAWPTDSGEPRRGFRVRARREQWQIVQKAWPWAMGLNQLNLQTLETLIEEGWLPVNTQARQVRQEEIRTLWLPLQKEVDQWRARVVGDSAGKDKAALQRVGDAIEGVLKGDDEPLKEAWQRGWSASSSVGDCAVDMPPLPPLTWVGRKKNKYVAIQLTGDDATLLQVSDSHSAQTVALKARRRSLSETF